MSVRERVEHSQDVAPRTSHGQFGFELYVGLV